MIWRIEPNKPTPFAATDANAKHHLAWAKENPWPGCPDVTDPLLDRDWWFYSGNIPPQRLTVFKHVPRGVQFWELESVAAAFHAGASVGFEPGLEDQILAGLAGPPEYVEAHKPFRAKGDE